MARAMAPEQHRTERGAVSASDAVAAPLSLLQRPQSPRAGTAPAEAFAAIGVGESLHLRSGANNLEGKGGVSVRAATFLEGDEPHIEAVYVKVTASEALSDGIAPPLTLPSSGVVSTGNSRGMQVEGLTDRCRHAQTAFSVVESVEEGRLCRS